MEFGQCWHKFDDVYTVGYMNIYVCVMRCCYNNNIRGLVWWTSDPKEKNNKVKLGNKEYWTAGEVSCWY